MPINKNQQVRLRILDECLSNFTKWHSIEDLLTKVNDHLIQEMGEEPVSKRTLYTDLKTLQNPDIFNAKVEKKKYDRKIFYRYQDKTFSIRKAPITHHQIHELQHILQSLEQVSNFPFGNWLDSIRKTSDLHLSLDFGQKPLIGIEHNPDLKGFHHFTDIFRAVINNQVLLIQYHDFAQKKYNYLIHPYYLKQYNQRWFLIGRNDSKPDTIWNLAIDRIESFQAVEQKFIHTNVDFEDYFYDIIGVTHREESKKEKIILRFSAESLPYILTKPLHPSQKQRKRDSETFIEISVKPNYELFSVLRSFGKNVEVVAPQYVRKEFLKELKANIDLYNK